VWGEGIEAAAAEEHSEAVVGSVRKLRAIVPIASGARSVRADAPILPHMVPTQRLRAFHCGPVAHKLLPPSSDGWGRSALSMSVHRASGVAPSLSPVRAHIVKIFGSSAKARCPEHNHVRGVLWGLWRAAAWQFLRYLRPSRGPRCRRDGCAGSGSGAGCDGYGGDSRTPHGSDASFDARLGAASVAAC